MRHTSLPCHSSYASQIQGVPSHSTHNLVTLLLIDCYLQLDTRWYKAQHRRDLSMSHYFANSRESLETEKSGETAAIDRAGFQMALHFSTYSADNEFSRSDII